MKIKKICILMTARPEWVAGYIYVSNIIYALQENYPELKITLILNPRGVLKNFQTTKHKNKLNIRHYVWHKEMHYYKRIVSVIYALLEGRRLASIERILHQSQPDFVYPYFDNNNKFNTANWIPDLQHKLLPDFFPDHLYESREKSVVRILSNTNHLVLSSQDAKAHLEKHYNTDNIQLSVLPFIAYFDSQIFEQSPINAILKYNLPKKFIIFSSNWWKHKNHLFLFKTVKKVSEIEKDICLVEQTRHKYCYNDL